MREIKFRAWSKKDKCWCNAFSIHKSGLFSEMINVRIENGIPIVDSHWQDLSKQDEIIVMQFTGLKDKNGKEIYEGDIVKTENKIYNFEIIFSNGSFGVLDRTARLTPFWQIKECEVIGNIYEHKNLLDNTELLNN